MPKVNLIQEIAELKQQLQLKQEVIDHYQKLLFDKYDDDIQKSCTNYNINDIQFGSKFDNIVQLPNLWFVTLNADPKMVRFSNDDEAMKYYLWLIHETFQKNPVVGVFEHTKTGQVHAHFLVTEYNIGDKVSQLKQKLTARTWLNYSVLAKPVTDSEGLKKYFIKENWISYNKNCGNLLTQVQDYLIEKLSSCLDCID